MQGGTAAGEGVAVRVPVFVALGALEREAAREVDLVGVAVRVVEAAAVLVVEGGREGLGEGEDSREGELEGAGVLLGVLVRVLVGELLAAEVREGVGEEEAAGGGGGGGGALPPPQFGSQPKPDP